ncbi:hypothetical protein Hanom_Chr12g01131081 [Helianthus anomalus]
MSCENYENSYIPGEFGHPFLHKCHIYKKIYILTRQLFFIYTVVDFFKEQCQYIFFLHQCKFSHAKFFLGWDR